MIPPTRHYPRSYRASVWGLVFFLALSVCYLMYGAFHFNPAEVATRSDIQASADEFSRELGVQHRELMAKLKATEDQQKKNIREIQRLKAKLNK